MQLTEEKLEISDLVQFANRLARRYGRIGMNDPEDIAQTVAIKLLDRKSFPDRTSLRWLHVVVRNTAWDMYRAQAREQRLIDRSVRVDYSGQPYIPGDNNDNITIRVQSAPQVCETATAEVGHHIQYAIAGLPKQQRAAFNLYAEGASYGVIAEKTGANIGTVRSRLHYARTALRSKLVDIV